MLCCVDKSVSLVLSFVFCLHPAEECQAQRIACCKRVSCHKLQGADPRSGRGWILKKLAARVSCFLVPYTPSFGTVLNLVCPKRERRISFWHAFFCTRPSPVKATGQIQRNNYSFNVTQPVNIAPHSQKFPCQGKGTKTVARFRKLKT